MSTTPIQRYDTWATVGNDVDLFPRDDGHVVKFADHEQSMAQQAQALAGAEDLIKRIRTAVTEYHLALDRREHGGIAGHKLTDAVRDILDMPWVQGEALAGIESLQIKPQ